MMIGIPKISVLMICYKQEELIKRAINSLLVQKEYIYEICVSDDCSPDKTWEVLQEYDRQYPGLFKLHRNSSNVGIFENIENTWAMPSGDIIYRLAGDDECGDGWFKTIIDYIHENGIDYKNELFCIYGDYKKMYPNGDSFICKNDMIALNPDKALKLALRYCLNNRTASFSSKILAKYVKCSQGRSHIAEIAQERQLQLYSEKNYYIPKVGNVYYSRIGESIVVDDEKLAERLKIGPYTMEILLNCGAELDKKDVICLTKARPAHEKMIYRMGVISFIRSFYYSIICRDAKIKYTSNIKKYLFALRRRLPHSSAVQM